MGQVGASGGRWALQGSRAPRGFPGLARPHRGDRRLRLPPLVVWGPAAFVAAVMVLPLLYLLLRASQAGASFWPLLFRLKTLELLAQSAGLALAVTLATIMLGVPLAWLTVRTDLPGRRLWSTLVALPLVIPTFVGAFAFISALGPRGLLQTLLAEPLGIQRLPEIYGFPGAWLALTLFTYPYVVLTVRPALRGMDPSLEEAARSLGQGAWSTFWRVTLPQLRPSIVAGGLLVALYTLSDFGVVSLLRYDTLTRAIYLQYQGSLDRTLAAGFALLLVALTAAILLVEARTRGRARYHRSTVGSVRPARPLRLGAWRLPALAFAASVVLAALVLPMAVLVYWAVQGLLVGATVQPVWQAALNSLLASGLGALATVLASLPVALLVVRYPSRLAWLVDRAVYVGFALPGIVIALSLVFFAARIATPLYQTLALLVVAYGIRFLPQALGATRSSLLQVSPHVEEAARGLGLSPAGVITRVTAPLVAPGLLSGGALVFLTAMKELPATLLLSPIGFETLATAVWSGAAEAFFAEAAVAALLLIGVSALPLTFLALDRGEVPAD